MSGQELVSIASATGAAILALIPVYQKWREIRREQDFADHEKGVDTLRQAVTAVGKNKDSLIIIALSLIIIGGLMYNQVHYGTILDRHYNEFLQIRDIINTRYGETVAQRKDILEKIEKIFQKLEKIKK